MRLAGMRVSLPSMEDDQCAGRGEADRDELAATGERIGQHAVGWIPGGIVVDVKLEIRLLVAVATVAFNVPTYSPVLDMLDGASTLSRLVEVKALRSRVPTAKLLL